MSLDQEVFEMAPRILTEAEPPMQGKAKRALRRLAAWKIWLSIGVVVVAQIAAVFVSDGMAQSAFIQDRMPLLQAGLAINVMIGVVFLGFALHHFMGNKDLIYELDRNQSEGFAKLEGIVEQSKSQLQVLNEDIGAKVINLEEAGVHLQDSLGRLKQLELRLNSSLEAYSGGDKYLAILKTRLNSLPRGEGALIGKSVRVVSSYKFLHKGTGPISDKRAEALKVVSQFAYDCRVQIKLLFSINSQEHLQEVQQRITEEICYRVQGIVDAHEGADDPHHATCLLVGFVDTSSQDMMLIPDGHTFLHFRTTGRAGARNGYYLESKEAYQSHRKRFQHMMYHSTKEATERLELDTAAWIAEVKEKLGDNQEYLQSF